MRVRVYDDCLTLSRAAAERAADVLRDAIRTNEGARLIAATGTSQFDVLDRLTTSPGIDWSRVEMFHLDEYIGLPVTHPASFGRFLLDRLIGKVGIERYHLLDGEHDPLRSAYEIGALLSERPADLALVGIGENGHLAFNDPPADFDTEEPYLLVTLDAACRRQQVGEGWFESIDQVPTRALSMSVRQILRSAEIIAVVPDARKAKAVRASIEGPVSPMVPASILQTHPNTTVFLDRDSASMLSRDE